MDTKIPEITEEDRRNYEWFVAKVAETSFVNNLPVEWFAQVEKLRTFGLPTVDFPPRDNVATFKAIVENIDKEYKAGNPLPLRMFIQDTKNAMTSSLMEGPFATGEIIQGTYGVYIYSKARSKASFAMVLRERYIDLIVAMWRKVQKDPENRVIYFYWGDGQVLDDFMVYGGWANKDDHLRMIGATTAIPAINGVYTYEKMKELFEEIGGSTDAGEAMNIGKRLMEYRAPVSEQRTMEREWSRRGRSLGEIDLTKKRWGDDWAHRYQSGGLFDSVKNVITGGVGKVGETRDSVIDRLNRGIRDFNFSLKTGAGYEEYDLSDDEDQAPSVAEALCLLVSQHTGVPCAQGAPWRDDLFGPAKLNYQKMLAALQLFLSRHGFDEQSGTHSVYRMLIHGDHECESIRIGESKGTKFKGPEMEELGAEWVPRKDMQDGEMFFAKGVPIRFSMVTRTGKDGAWVSLTFPLSTKEDGTSVYLTHDEAGNVTGLMIIKPSARGHAWTRIWQPAGK